jgi:hypothetical protein
MPYKINLLKLSKLCAFELFPVKCAWSVVYHDCLWWPNGEGPYTAVSGTSSSIYQRGCSLIDFVSAQALKFSHKQLLLLGLCKQFILQLVHGCPI